MGKKSGLFLEKCVLSPNQQKLKITEDVNHQHVSTSCIQWYCSSTIGFPLDPPEKCDCSCDQSSAVTACQFPIDTSVQGKNSPDLQRMTNSDTRQHISLLVEHLRRKQTAMRRVATTIKKQRSHSPHCKKPRRHGRRKWKMVRVSCVPPSGRRDSDCVD